MPNYWINTVSRDHVHKGVEEGFTQTNHGRDTGLQRLARGDLIAFYSPRTSYPDGEPLRRFTAIARVIDDAPYQVEMTLTFHPWRRRVAFLSSSRRRRSRISSPASPSSSIPSAGARSSGAGSSRSAPTISTVSPPA